MPNRLAIALAPAFATGCLVVPQAKQPACTMDTDCDTSAGEVCDEGACYGGPPSGEFAALLVPPSNRTDLVTTDIGSEALPTDGDLGTVTIAGGVKLSGRVEAYCVAPAQCTDTTIAATVTISRPSRFAGGPSFSALATAQAGIARGTDSFSLVVPPTTGSDAPFTLTIEPQNSGAAPPSDGSTSAAQLAPPMQVMVTATTDTELGTFTLGGGTSAVITGTVTDATSTPLSQYRVVALGHLGSAGAPLSEVSTVDYTTDGTYSIALAGCSGSACAAIAGDVEIDASPYGDAAAPTLYATGVPAAPGVVTLAQPAAIGAPVPLVLAISGLGGNGAVEPVAGARVFVTSTATPYGSAFAELSDDVETGSDGNASVTLLDGDAFAAGYAIDVIPPPGSELGVLESSLSLGSAAIRLPARVQLYGTVTDAGGAPVPNISVTATPSLRYEWSLDTAGQTLLSAIPTPSAFTDASGAFSLWVDPSIAGVGAIYDLEFTATGGVAAANWAVTEIAIPQDATQTSVSVGTEQLPATAYMHGVLADASGALVLGGELAIYQLESDPLLCGAVADPPSTCVIPAQLLGQGTAGSDGTVVLALPRAPASP